MKVVVVVLLLVALIFVIRWLRRIPEDSGCVAAGLVLLWLPVVAGALGLGWWFLWPIECPNCSGTGAWAYSHWGGEGADVLDLGYRLLNKGSSCLACDGDGKLTPHQLHVVYPREAEERDRWIGEQIEALLGASP